MRAMQLMGGVVLALVFTLHVLDLPVVPCQQLLQHTSFCGSSMSRPDKLVCGSLLLPIDENSGQPIIALEAVPVDNSYWHIPSGFVQDDAEVTVTSRTRTS